MLDHIGARGDGSQSEFGACSQISWTKRAQRPRTPKATVHGHARLPGGKVRTVHRPARSPGSRYEAALSNATSEGKFNADEAEDTYEEEAPPRGECVDPGCGSGDENRKAILSYSRMSVRNSLLRFGTF